MRVTVDGIHCLIDEPRPFCTTHKSKKLGQAGLVCECGVCAHKDKIAWTNGPFPAGTNDKTVFKKALKGKVETERQQRNNDFCLITDDGHFAEAFLDALAFRNELDPREVACFKDRALSRHERFNGLTKNHKVLTTNFNLDHGHNPNHDHPWHKAVVEAICVSVQIEFDEGTLSLFNPCPAQTSSASSKEIVLLPMRQRMFALKLLSHL